nr:putative transposon, En/Spm-like protein [Tanacetum cinerariifolium]
MDKSWMRTSRAKKKYIDGVEALVKYAVHNLQKMRNINPRGNKQQLMMPCPCTTYLNHIEHKVEEVQFHLFKYMIDLSYTKWDKHGEKDEQATTAQIPVNATTEFVNDTDFDMDFGLEIPTDCPATVEMVNTTKESFDEDDLAKFQELLLDAEKPLYKGCQNFTKLSTIVKLLNLKGQKLMRMMGSGHKKIHVCSNNCILYWKDNKELTVFLTYGVLRRKVDNKTHKVYENIPEKEETYCFLYIPSSVLARENVTCATATVYRIGDGIVHFKKLLKGHMKVSVIKVVEIHKSMELPVSGDEIPNLESAVKGFIQWLIAAIARFTILYLLYLPLGVIH